MLHLPSGSAPLRGSCAGAGAARRERPLLGCNKSFRSETIFQDKDVEVRIVLLERANLEHTKI
jgi:hypothetical protein